MRLAWIAPPSLEDAWDAYTCAMTYAIEHPIRFESRRSPVLSTRGIVGASQPLAALAGLQILREGGNAADAAVATAAALAVTEPTSTGIGGDCFCLF